MGEGVHHQEFRLLAPSASAASAIGCKADSRAALRISDHPLGELDIPVAGPRVNGGEIPRGPLEPSRLELDKPVIAAIEGPAVAGGMELGPWRDFRVMAKESYFGVYCRRWAGAADRAFPAGLRACRPAFRARFRDGLGRHGDFDKIR